jgi:hypothetical protein
MKYMEQLEQTRNDVQLLAAEIIRKVFAVITKTVIATRASTVSNEGAQLCKTYLSEILVLVNKLEGN